MNQTNKVIKHFLFNKKGASVVVSTIILTAGVLAMSIAVLYWTYSMGKIGNIEYSKNTATSTSAVLERLGYESVSYSASTNTLTAYIVNWGKTDNITIVHVLVLDRFYNVIGSNTIGPNYAPVKLFSIDRGNEVTGDKLRIGTDAYFRIQITTASPLDPNQLYYVRIVTSNGRNYDGSFSPTP